MFTKGSTATERGGDRRTGRGMEEAPGAPHFQANLATNGRRTAHETTTPSSSNPERANRFVAQSVNSRRPQPAARYSPTAWGTRRRRSSLRKSLFIVWRVEACLTSDQGYPPGHPRLYPYPTESTGRKILGEGTCLGERTRIHLPPNPCTFRIIADLLDQTPRAPQYGCNTSAPHTRRTPSIPLRRIVPGQGD